MRLFICLISAAFIFATSTLAAPWSDAAKAQMDAAGARLSTATTTAERVAALREIDSIVAAHPDSDEAALMAEIIGQKATQEAGPKAMLDALSDLAGSGEITDVNSYAAIVGPMMDNISKMQEDGTLLPSTAIALDDAIKKLDAAAKKANLPSVADAISQATGDPNLGATLRNTLGRVASLAQLARDTPNLAEMDEKATKAYIDRVIGLIPPGLSPALSGPGGVIFRDTLAWNNSMWQESTKGLDLVSEAIRTGEFNTEEYNKVRDRLNQLSAGPWGSDTAKDFFKALCKGIPVAGAWCDDVFKAVENVFAPLVCEEISCDCENVGGGLMRGPLIVQCELAQQSLRMECEATKAVTGSCDAGAVGPGASH